MREILTEHHQACLKDPLFLSQLKFVVCSGQLESVLSQCDLRTMGLQVGHRSVLLVGRPIGDNLRISGQRRSSFLSLLKMRIPAIAKSFYSPVFAPLQKALNRLLAVLEFR
jgi:hypothetical protein